MRLSVRTHISNLLALPSRLLKALGPATTGRHPDVLMDIARICATVPLAALRFERGNKRSRAYLATYSELLATRAPYPLSRDRYFAPGSR